MTFALREDICEELRNEVSWRWYGSVRCLMIATQSIYAVALIMCWRTYSGAEHTLTRTLIARCWRTRRAPTFCTSAMMASDNGLRRHAGQLVGYRRDRCGYRGT